MSWDAGAITGRLGLNISEYAHGMLQAEGLMQVMPAMFTEFLENPLLGVAELFKQSAEAATEWGHKIIDTLGEVAAHAQHTGLDALKSGVSVDFLSGLEAAGKRVGVTADAIGNSFRFLERNAVGALEGEQQAAQGFQALGISAQFLQANLNNSEAMFKAVREGLNQIPSASERTRAALQVLGREGAGMIPLFLQSNEAMKDSIDTARALGAVEDEESVKSAQGWFKVTAAIDDMWEGLKKAFSDAFLQQINDNWGLIRQTIIDLSKTLRETIPAATFAAVSAMELLLKAFENFAAATVGFGMLTDKLGFTHGLADAAAQFAADLKQIERPLDEIIDKAKKLHDEFGKSPAAAAEAPGSWVDRLHINPNFTFDGNEASSQVVAKLMPVVQDAMGRNQVHQQKMMQKDAAAQALGGRRPNYFVPGK